MLLVTGGTGYIGSITAKYLEENNEDVLILDNLTTSKITSQFKRAVKAPVVKGDVSDSELVTSLLTGSHKSCRGKRVTGIIHFAESAYVGESKEDPAKYYKNHLINTISFLETIKNCPDPISKNLIPIVFQAAAQHMASHHYQNY